MEQIPFVAHESAMHRMEKTNKRMWILCLVLIAALILSNAAWVIYESQFETVTETTVTEQETESYDIVQDNDDGNTWNIIGNEGDVKYGSPKD